MGMRNGNKPKLHVLLSKEEIDVGKIDSGKVAVVFDILLATTTISALLHYGANEVIPVMDAAEALEIKHRLDETTTILAGELGGRTIEGFSDPLPTHLQHLVKEKTIVLSTTNGTVAVRKVSAAKQVYAASLPNGDAVARKIANDHTDDTVIVVCAGSMGRFSLEDFYGAGYFIHNLLNEKEAWELTDSAKAALFFYQGNEARAEEILTTSATGEMMVRGGLLKDILFSAEKGTIPVVPQT